MSDPASELEKLRAELAATKAELAQARAVVSTSEAMIAGLKLEIALLRREQYGHSAERTARLIDQLELQLEDLVTTAAEDRVWAERTTVSTFERRKPVRKPFPEHLPRERVVVEAPKACTCRGSDRIVKLGEDITETLEVVPRRWKVVQTSQSVRRSRIKLSGGEFEDEEGHGSGTREVHLSGLREDQPGSGPIPPGSARLGRTGPAGDDCL